MDSTNTKPITPTDALREPDHASMPVATSSTAASNQFDVNAILAEVEALAGIAAQAMGEPTTSAAPSHGAPEVASHEFASLEREIEALLRGSSSETSAAPEATASPIVSSATIVPVNTAATTSIAASAIRSDPIDPLIREINEILDDDNEAILKGSSGDVSQALRTVFDPRALSGQEEDVNRALIEAFGTSRSMAGTFSAGIVTNPVPKFEGISRSVPTRTFEEIAATSIARDTKVDYAGETPFEPAFPVVPIVDAAATNESVTAPISLPSPTLNLVPTASAVEQTPTPVLAAVVMVAKPTRDWLAPVRRAVCTSLPIIATFPLRACAFPMKIVPESGRQIVTIAALSMVLWVPVSWWLAHRTTSAQGIGRIEFPAPPASPAETSAAEKDDKKAASSSSKSSGH